MVGRRPLNDETLGVLDVGRNARELTWLVRVMEAAGRVRLCGDGVQVTA